MSMFEIRSAKESDLNEIMAIENHASPAPWNRNQFGEEMHGRGRFLWVTTFDPEGGGGFGPVQVVGYLVFRENFGEGQILNVAVAELFRKRGLAKKMLEKALLLLYSMGVSKVGLEVRRSNKAAVKCYERIGFSILCVRNRFYSNGEDAFSMWIDLGKFQGTCLNLL